MTSPPPTEVLRGGAEVIDRLAGEWRALCEGSAYDQPFYRPEWFSAHVRAFAPDSELCVVTARVEGHLTAVLPLIREFAPLDGLPAQKLRAVANAHTPRFDVIHRADEAEASLPAMWRALLGIPGWNVLTALNVPHRGAFARLARAAHTRGHPVHAMRSLTSPYLPLQSGESGFEHVLARVDAKFRANLRRRARKLESLGRVQLVRRSVVDELLPRLYELERSGWKGAERSAIASDARTRQFYDDLAREAERFGHLSLYGLACNGRPVAAYYGLTHGGRYFLLKTAYDESLGECSPGQLITSAALRDLTRMGCTEFDFLGPLMEWKKDWAPRLRPHADWYVFRGASGRLLYAVRFRMRRAAGRLRRRVMRQLRPSRTSAPAWRSTVRVGAWRRTGTGARSLAWFDCRSGPA